MLSVRCLSASCLSVTLVHSGHTVGWIKIKRVGLAPRHIVLDGDTAPPTPKGHSPQFSAHICCGQRAVWIKMPLCMEVGLGPSKFALDGYPAPASPKWGGAPQKKIDQCLLWPNGWMDQDDTWYGGRPQPRDFVLDGDPAPFPKRGRSTQFSVMSIAAKRLHGSRYHLIWR